jgi:uncharacterized protein YcsI (UPF0317 family)
VADGWVQANLVVVPSAYSAEFREFCARNPQPCPLLDETLRGSPEPSIASGADLRTDIGRYRVYRDGQLAEEVDDLKTIWRPDFVAFLLGCSFTFESALSASGVPLRHVELGCNVAMYRTNRASEPLVETAVKVTGQFPRAHGAPVHVGDPAGLGIRDLGRPDYGDPLPIRSGEVPVFWACGVTPQAAAEAAELPIMVTHAPGYMFITDMRDEDLAQPAG